MKSLFNEAGVPNDDLNRAADRVGVMVRNFLNEAIEEGYPIGDLRGAGCVFTQAITCEVAHAVLGAMDKKRQERYRNSDKRLNDKEMEFVRTGNKIRAIKEYRDRTGAGLKEAKDDVERWMREYLGR